MKFDLSRLFFWRKSKIESATLEMTSSDAAATKPTGRSAIMRSVWARYTPEERHERGMNAARGRRLRAEARMLGIDQAQQTEMPAEGFRSLAPGEDE